MTQTNKMQKEWISIKDKLPGDATGCLVYMKSLQQNGGGAFETSIYLYGDFIINEPDFYEVTHWMPLPEPPKQEAA